MVAARETTIQELLEGTKQYQIPLYQRTYSWSKDQLERMWADIVLLAEDRRHDHQATHFVGSLVLAPGANNGPTGIQEYLVIDGQQRLTTLTLLLCALRDHRAEHESPEHRARIDQQFLTNPWKNGDQRLKVVPTQADRASYRLSVDGSHLAGGEDLIGRAYSFFLSKLLGEDLLGDLLAEDVENAVLLGLSVVSVTAQTGDNVYRIFESLNNTGLQLSQADLLRNYIFMRLPSQGESVYTALRH